MKTEAITHNNVHFWQNFMNEKTHNKPQKHLTPRDVNSKTFRARPTLAVRVGKFSFTSLEQNQSCHLNLKIGLEREEKYIKKQFRSCHIWSRPEWKYFTKRYVKRDFRFLTVMLMFTMFHREIPLCFSSDWRQTIYVALLRALECCSFVVRHNSNKRCKLRDITLRALYLLLPLIRPPNNRQV